MSGLWAVHAPVGKAMVMAAVPMWQLVTIVALLAAVVLCRRMKMTGLLRGAIQPGVSKWVERGVPFLLRLQLTQNPFLDSLFSGLSTVVSVEFYQAFLPLLFWSGHGRLGRQMTLLMAACMYVGNFTKDVVSAPRPPSPPVRRYVTSHAEKDAAMEYGLPSSHTMNTLCLSVYLLYSLGGTVSPWFGTVLALLLPIVVLVIFGRLYLGMHTPVDIIAGAGLGVVLLLIWISVDQVLDAFITGGQNVQLFWAALSVLLQFAYPTPQLRTPSFEFHTAFNGVVLGVVCGSHRAFAYTGGDPVAIPLHTWAGFMVLTRRSLLGLPVILTVKGITKALSIRLLPLLSRSVGLPIYSSSYIPLLHSKQVEKEQNTVVTTSPASAKESGHKNRLFLGQEIEPFDVDTGVRLLQYAGVGWSVIEVVPFFFRTLNL